MTDQVDKCYNSNTVTRHARFDWSLRLWTLRAGISHQLKKYAFDLLLNSSLPSLHTQLQKMLNDQYSELRASSLQLRKCKGLHGGRAHRRHVICYHYWEDAGIASYRLMGHLREMNETMLGNNSTGVQLQILKKKGVLLETTVNESLTFSVRYKTRCFNW